MDEIVKALKSKFNMKAAIFDLDGTLIDNNSVHLKSWLQYLKNMGRVVSESEYREHFNGRTNKDVLEYIFDKEMTIDEALPYTLEKEALYRELYKDDIAPVAGLVDLLQALHAAGIPMAIATSGIQPNIDFMFEHINIRQYFPIVINSSHIVLGKPHPEIYLKAAEALGVDPKNCLVFEDAVVGIQSAKAAGMQVVAITTTEGANALSAADLIVADFLPASFPL
jgi:beta-phosphoglucomutase family hydrolase